uniref:Uncharacterized protein n=1 Tax=Arundo donax TaxID=35708 RepID=A0A0A9EDW8_ARUDO
MPKQQAKLISLQALSSPSVPTNKYNNTPTTSPVTKQVGIAGQVRKQRYL